MSTQNTESNSPLTVSSQADTDANPNIVSAREFWERSFEIPVLDVRSPCEFADGHIPSAINLPLFSDEQRAEVGTIYKNQGREPAIIKGLEFVGPRLAEMVSRAKSIAKSRGSGDEILVHCWRGGMRSQSLARILELTGMNPVVLNGGYKAFRKLARSALGRPLKMVVVSGFTGAGKTLVLNQLEDAGEQVLDLERLANHRGSAFGGISQGGQPRTEHFENQLFRDIDQLDLNRPVWIEDEGNRIGSVVVDNQVCEQIRNAPAVVIDRSVENRVEHLMADYGDLPPEDLIFAIGKIKKRLGGEQTQRAIRSVENGDVRTAIEIVLTYYDKTYQSAMTKMPREVSVNVPADDLSVEALIVQMREIADRVTEDSAAKEPGTKEPAAEQSK